MSSTHILTTTTPSISTSTTLTTTSPQHQPSPTPTLASLPLQTPDSKWHIHCAGREPTCSFPPLEPSIQPLVHAAAIQIPGSQWRLALKTRVLLKSQSATPRSPASSTSPTSLQPFTGPRLGRALPISRSSASGVSSSSSLTGPSSSNSQRINSDSDTQTGPPERKRTYLDALKYENAIRMQLTIKPKCQKLERKMGYLRRWKDRWAKFDNLRRTLGCVVGNESAGGQGHEGDGRNGEQGAIGYEGHGGLMPTRNVEQLINRSYGDWRRIIWPSLQNFSLPSNGNHMPLTGSRVEHERRQKGARKWLDELEREWWGDGFPMPVEGGDIGNGRNCWLDEVD